MLIAETPHFKIWRFFAFNSLRNYSYIIQQKTQPEVLVVDPWDGEFLQRWANKQGLLIKGVLNTHGHSDHTSGNAALLAMGCLALTESSWLKRMPTPGHTMDHVGFLLDDGSESHFFAGDTIFHCGVGNCKHGGDPAILFQTVNALRSWLTPTTVIHPGHDYALKNRRFAQWVEPQFASRDAWPAREGESHDWQPFSWGTECRYNPFLRLGEQSLRDGVCTLRPRLRGETIDEMTLFCELRVLRDHYQG